MKKKFKLKPSKNNLLNKLKAPFLNKKNHFVVGGILLLFSFFLVIAFSSFFINWKADNSLVLDASFSSKQVSNFMDIEKLIENTVPKISLPDNFSNGPKYIIFQKKKKKKKYWNKKKN